MHCVGLGPLRGRHIDRFMCRRYIGGNAWRIKARGSMSRWGAADNNAGLTPPVKSVKERRRIGLEDFHTTVQH